MSKRSRIPFDKSRKSFTRGANRTHRYNLNMRPMRGGTRL